MKKTSVGLSALLAFIFFSFTNTFAADQRIGKELNFSLPDQLGYRADVRDFRGTYVLLNFWASWCGPCKDEMPSLQKLSDQFRGKMWVITVNSADTDEERARALMKTFPRLTVLFDRDDTVMALYGVRSFPMTFLLDPRSRIVEIIYGARDWQSPEIQEYFENLLR